MRLWESLLVVNVGNIHGSMHESPRRCNLSYRVRHGLELVLQPVGYGPCRENQWQAWCRIMKTSTLSYPSPYPYFSTLSLHSLIPIQPAPPSYLTLLYLHFYLYPHFDSPRPLAPPSLTGSCPSSCSLTRRLNLKNVDQKTRTVLVCDVREI